MDDDIAAEMAAKSWIDMSVLNSEGPDVTRGGRINGILYNHDEAKSLGSLDSKGIEDHIHGEVSEDFAQRNGGIAGLRNRNSAQPEEAAASAKNRGSSGPSQQGGRGE